jgi:hypothetical protein
MPFSKEAIDLFKMITRSDDDEIEKAEMMLQLANLFVDDTSDTDEGVNEEIHDLVSNVVESRITYERHAMLLARILMRSIPQFLSQNPEANISSDPVEKSKAN